MIQQMCQAGQGIEAFVPDSASTVNQPTTFKHQKFSASSSFVIAQNFYPFSTQMHDFNSSSFFSDHVNRFQALDEFGIPSCMKDPHLPSAEKEDPDLNPKQELLLPLLLAEISARLVRSLRLCSSFTRSTSVSIAIDQ